MRALRGGEPFWSDDRAQYVISPTQWEINFFARSSSSCTLQRNGSPHVSSARERREMTRGCLTIRQPHAVECPQVSFKRLFVFICEAISRGVESVRPLQDRCGGTSCLSVSSRRTGGRSLPQLFFLNLRVQLLAEDLHPLVDRCPDTFHQIFDGPFYSDRMKFIKTFTFSLLAFTVVFISSRLAFIPSSPAFIYPSLAFISAIISSWPVFMVASILSWMEFITVYTLASIIYWGLSTFPPWLSDVLIPLSSLGWPLYVLPLVPDRSPSLFGYYK